MKVLHYFNMLLLLAGLLELESAARAQEHEHPAGDVQQLGQVMFSTSGAPEVQEDFNRAVAMLHSFWYQKSEKAFELITQKDPSCALAHWGIAMSRRHQVHTPECEQLPDESSRIYLGDFDSYRTAIRKARKMYSNSDGCPCVQISTQSAQRTSVE